MDEQQREYGLSNSERECVARLLPADTPGLDCYRHGREGGQQACFEEFGAEMCIGRLLP